MWPEKWPARDPLVEIHAFILLDNHFHLILKEIKEGGITKFMRKLGTGMTNRFNTRYEETGRLFQGAYKARRIDEDNYLRYLTVYIMVKNAFELYPGGFSEALNSFDDAFEFAANYPYSSLGGYFSDEHTSSEIISKKMISDIIKSKEEFKVFAQSCLNFVYFDEKHTRVSVEGVSVEV